MPCSSIGFVATDRGSSQRQIMIGGMLGCDVDSAGKGAEHAPASSGQHESRQPSSLAPPRRKRKVLSKDALPFGEPLELPSSHPLRGFMAPLQTLSDITWRHALASGIYALIDKVTFTRSGPVAYFHCRGHVECKKRNGWKGKAVMDGSALRLFHYSSTLCAGAARKIDGYTPAQWKVIVSEDTTKARTVT